MKDIYIYIYIYRERERERERYTCSTALPKTTFLPPNVLPNILVFISSSHVANFVSSASTTGAAVSGVHKVSCCVQEGVIIVDRGESQGVMLCSGVDSLGVGESHKVSCCVQEGMVIVDRG